MAPTSAQPAASPGFKLPPTGPKALRGIGPNGSGQGQSASPTAGPSNHRNIHLPAPQHPNAGYAPAPNGLFNRNGSNGGGAWQQRGGFRGRGRGMGVNMGMNGHGGFHGQGQVPNGMGGMGVMPPSGPSSQYGESSRQGLSGSLVRPPSPTSTRPPSPPMPPPSASSSNGRASTSASAKRSVSPVKRRKSRSPEKARQDDEDFRSTLISDRHAPISISLPSVVPATANGRARPLPPHMPNGSSSRAIPPPPPKEEPPGPPPSSPPPPPLRSPPPPSPPPRGVFTSIQRSTSPAYRPPRAKRPPTPPDPPPSPPVAPQSSRPRSPSFPPKSRPLTPPIPSSPIDSPSTDVSSSKHEASHGNVHRPAPISIPLPSSSSVGRSISRVPSPKPSSTSRQPSPPPSALSQSSGPTLPPFAPTLKPAGPPAFHFRDLSARRPPSNAGSDDEASLHEEIVLEPALPSPRSTYVPPPYVPPPSTRHRPGLGNFIVISDIGQAKKGIVKRFDGVLDGKEVTVTDPRLKSDDWKRGRGSSKVRPTLYEVEYEWDECSTGPKPPPPPEAVLITNLNPLTTVDQIRKFLQPHGRAREINSKMDSKSGMQLGICWVKFDGPASGKKGSAHEVAVQVAKVCDGQRIGLSGTEKIRVVLDGRGLRTEKAVKEEMARRYPPKKVAPPKPPPVPPTPVASTPKASTPSSGAGTPRTDIARATPASSSSTPSRPAIVVRPLHASLPVRPRMGVSNQNSPFAPRSFPSRQIGSRFNHPANLPVRPPTTQDLSSAFGDSAFDSRRGRSTYLADSYEPDRRSRSRSRSRGRSHPRSCSTCSSRSFDSDDDDRRFDRRPRRTPSPAYRGRARGKPAPKRDTKEDEIAIQRVRKGLEENGKSHVFIDSTALPEKSVNDADLWNHFRTYKPIQVLSNFQGWYILFDNDSAAAKAKLLDNTMVKGHRLVISVRPPVTKKAADSLSPTAEKQKPSRSLAIPKKYAPPPRPPPKRKSPSPGTPARNRARSYSSSEGESEIEVRPLARRKVAQSASSDSDLSEDERTLLPELSTNTPGSDEASTIVVALDTPEPVKQLDDEPMQAGKKRPGKPKAAKKPKKAKLDPTVLEVVPKPDPDVAEIKLDILDTPDKPAKPAKAPKAKPAKVSKPRKPAKTELEKFLETGVVLDEEDAYWLGQVVAATHDGAEVDLSDGEMSNDEGQTKEEHPLYHQAGSWRANGWKKVPQIAKAEYLPERNRAVVSKEDASALTTGRTARVTGRRLAHDMETTRKTATAAIANTAESDMFAFNQLRIRKKQLRFSRSPIEGYGLYAMETIHPGEMVCEYVGEICRSAVAEVREQRYLKQGIGSSYLFRIDADMVCDATFKGSVSRLINHSCDPSASAKIISINGQSKIVIYAKRTLHPGQEILYDYKFPLESDPALRVPCLCGAATCRGWLN